jgi:hypothetical protein
MDNILIPMIDDSETTVTVTVSTFEGVRLNSSTDGYGGGDGRRLTPAAEAEARPKHVIFV